MLKKVVDGVEVECSAEEEAAIRSQWQADEDQRRQELSAKTDLLSTLDAAIQGKDTNAALLAIKQLLAEPD